MDTIFALASARGKAGIAVVRLSGSLAHLAVAGMCTGLPEPRRASLRKLQTSEGAFLDEALVLIFEPEQSFTGEAVAELHLHGSPAIVKAALEHLASIDGLRQATAGEFTRRALENERLDIAQVEGLADLIEAETEAQRKQAIRVFSGAIGEKADLWRRSLIRATALIEATIDFVDEDVPVDVRPEVLELIADVMKELESEVVGVGIAERVRDGFEVAIVGAPNTGKSTLLNYLAGREAAITSEHAGTTRDVIEVRMDIRGIPVTLLDTAGVRETPNSVEAIGVRRTLERAAQADLRLFLLRSRDDLPIIPLRDEDLTRISKCDLLDDQTNGISGATGRGVKGVLDEIAGVLETRVASVGVATKVRHQAAITRALERLQIASLEVKSGEHRADVASEELRTAVVALDSLVGRVDVEHILDEIFLSFCIGK